MRQLRVSNVTLLMLSAIVSSVVHVSTLLNPNRLAYAGGDVFHNIWTYKRNWSYLLSFDSNFLNQIQYPNKGSAFTGELQLGNTLLFKLLNAIVKNEIHTYGFMLFLSGILIFISIFKIARLLGTHEAIGLMVATYATSAMYLSNHISHIQVTAFFWLTVPIWQILELRQLSVAFVRIRKSILFFSVFFLFAGPSYLNIILIFSILISAFSILLSTSIKSANPLLDLRILVIKGVISFKGILTVIIPSLFVSLFFWIPFILQALRNDNIRTVSQVSPYRVDLSQFLNPSINNWLYGQHNFSNFVLAGDSLFPGIVVIGLIVIGICSTRLKISFIQLYVLYSGLFLILISLSSPITLFGYSIIPNPIFLAVAGLGGLSATRYLPTLAFFGFVFVLLAATARINFFPRWKQPKVWFATTLICAMIIVENAPSSSLILPTQPRLSSNWTILQPALSNAKEKYVGIYPGPSLPLDPADPLFWVQFEWMAGLAEVPLKFVGGNSGFNSNQGTEMMAKLQKRKTLEKIPFISCLLKERCLLIVDKNGLKQISAPEQLGFIEKQARALGFPIQDFPQFLIIGLEAR
jgi:hypothetical protein